MVSVAEFLGSRPFETALLCCGSLTLILFSTIYLVRYAQRASLWLWRSVGARYSLLRFERLEKGRLFLWRHAHWLPWLIVLCCWVGFFEIAEVLAENPLLKEFDETWVSAAHRSVASWELALFSTVTAFAGRAASYLIGFGFAFYLIAQGRRRDCVLWAFGILYNSLVVQLLKTYYERGRPEFDQPFLIETNFSFPSGHAAASLLLFGLLAYLKRERTVRQERPWQMKASLLLIIAGTFIGTSRLVLGVHFPSDILAGWLIGTAALATVIGIDLNERPQTS